MKVLLKILLLSTVLFSQVSEYVSGTITYKSSQHIYVRFEDSDGLEKGDSVFTMENLRYKFAGIVKYLSSTSSAIETELNLAIGSIVYRKKAVILQENEQSDDIGPDITEPSIEIEIQDTNSETEGKESKFYGRIGLTSYSNLTNRSRSINTQRWKYLSSLNYDYIGGSNFSMTSYVTFAYRTHEWGRVQENLMNALKVYNLALKYDFNETTNIWFGRRINSNLANISTIDGLQFESKIGEFKYGLVVGSRPHFSDFGFNAKLFEYGGYVARTDSINNKYMKNSFAVFQQTNNFKTDRRFLYFQHNNNLIENVNLFLSTEVDLYKRENGVGESSFSLTSFYFLTRYSPSRIISLSASYDARKNVVYYETYKSVADSILESETRQGFRFRITLRPFKYTMFNIGTGYRFRPGDPKPTRNFNGSLSYTRVPVINSSVSISGNILQTNYLDGQILGIRMYKDLFDGMLNVGVGYRNLRYEFSSGMNDLNQNIFETNLSFRFSYSIYFNVSYEGVFQDKESYGRVFINLTKRFR